MIGASGSQAQSPAPKRIFDLSDLVLATRRTARRGRAGYTFTALVSGGILAYAVASRLTNRTPMEYPLASFLAVVVLIALFFGISVLGFIGAGTGATKCELDGDGARLSYRSGRERVVRWRDPRIRMRLTSVTSATTAAYDLTVGYPMLNPVLRFPMLNPVSAELYSAILSEAHLRKLMVRSANTQARGVSVTTHHIRAGVSTEA